MGFTTKDKNLKSRHSSDQVSLIWSLRRQAAGWRYRRYKREEKKKRKDLKKIRKGNGKVYLHFCKPRPFKNTSLEK